MRSLACILLIGSLIGCNNKEIAEQPAPSDTTATSQTLPSKFERLFALYPSITFDSLRVESPHYEDNGNLIGKFIGKPLDSAAFSQLRTLLGRDIPPLSEGYFAYGKFAVEPGLVGLITRVPGMYSPSKVHLYLVDPVKDVLVSDLELSEHWGDAGDVFLKQSVLKPRVEGLLIRVEEQSSYYHSIEDENNDSVTIGNLDYEILLARDRRDSTYLSSSKRTVLSKH